MHMYMLGPELGSDVLTFALQLTVPIATEPSHGPHSTYRAMQPCRVAARVVQPTALLDLALCPDLREHRQHLHAVPSPRVWRQDLGPQEAEQVAEKVDWLGVQLAS
jgi:hypothetical protein